MISDLKNKATILRPAAPTKTAGGGLVASEPLASFTKSYKIENRSGTLQTDSAQREWNYDYKLTGRYYPSFVEQSSDLIKFQDKTLVIRSVSFDGEGARKMVILRCSTNE